MKTKSFFIYCLCSLLFCITSTAEIKPVIRKMTFKQADETLLHVNHVANSQYSFYTTTDGARHGDVYTGLLLYIVASIALAWFYHNFKLRNEDTKH